MNQAKRLAYDMMKQAVDIKEEPSGYHMIR
jgi:hypothetical protein